MGARLLRVSLLAPITSTSVKAAAIYTLRLLRTVQDSIEARLDAVEGLLRCKLDSIVSHTLCS